MISRAFFLCSCLDASATGTATDLSFLSSGRQLPLLGLLCFELLLENASRQKAIPGSADFFLFFQGTQSCGKVSENSWFIYLYYYVIDLFLYKNYVFYLAFQQFVYPVTSLLRPFHLCMLLRVQGTFPLTPILSSCLLLSSHPGQANQPPQCAQSFTKGRKSTRLFQTVPAICPKSC